MKRILFAVALCISLSAMATQPGNNGGGNGGCGVGQQTNGCGGTTPGNGGQGGAGGAGGAGGSAAAIAAAQARAEARATAIAAQQQAQSQTSRNTNRNTNTVKSNVTTGSVNVNVSLPAGATPDKAAAPLETTATTKEAPAAQKSDTLVVDNDNTRYPVSTAYAAPLTATNGTCMGSSSAGAQGAALGVSFGTTWTDTSCDIRYDAEALRAAGLPIAARARLCQKAEIAKAMEAAGTPCPKADDKRAEQILNGETVTQRQAMPWQAGG